MIVLLWTLAAVTWAQDVARGEVLAGLSGCEACHTAEAGQPWAGGHAVVSRFGTFYGTNLTQDPEHGLGAWNEADFVRAMREGRGPDHRAYWPAFPYPAFTLLTDADLGDLWAYLQTIPPAAVPNRPHEVLPRFNSRPLLGLWRSMGFRPGPWEDDPHHEAAWNRGAYLVEGPGHCGECHTPRNGVGIPKRSATLAGSTDPKAPNLTPHASALQGWSASDWDDFLTFAMTPDGDVVGGHMAVIIEHGTARLSAEDRMAMAVYLRSLTPQPFGGLKPKAP